MNIIPSPSNIGSMKTNPYRKCNRLDGLKVETSSLNYRVVRPVVDISKSVSPDSTEIIFWLFILNLFYTKTRVFLIEKNDNGKIRDNTNILIMHCVVLNKNK
jgi:hypothetical protein